MLVYRWVIEHFRDKHQHISVNLTFSLSPEDFRDAYRVARGGRPWMSIYQLNRTEPDKGFDDDDDVMCRTSGWSRYRWRYRRHGRHWIVRRTWSFWTFRTEWSAGIPWCSGSGRSAGFRRSVWTCGTARKHWYVGLFLSHMRAYYCLLLECSINDRTS